MSKNCWKSPQKKIYNFQFQGISIPCKHVCVVFLYHDEAGKFSDFWKISGFPKKSWISETNPGFLKKSRISEKNPRFRKNSRISEKFPDFTPIPGSFRKIREFVWNPGIFYEKILDFLKKSGNFLVCLWNNHSKTSRKTTRKTSRKTTGKNYRKSWKSGKI